MQTRQLEIQVRRPGMNSDLRQQMLSAWKHACVIDLDAAMMIAEQHNRKKISAEQTITALLSMVFAGDYMNTYSQLYS